MFANLLVLPSLVLTVEKWSGKSDSLEEPTLKVLRNEEPEEDTANESEESNQR